MRSEIVLEKPSHLYVSKNMAVYVSVSLKSDDGDLITTALSRLVEEDFRMKWKKYC